ncbi:MAG: hypothetical protein JKY03_12355 [Aureispira sp.]|nr:hypothetical protein [Aureispira sp.]
MGILSAAKFHFIEQLIWWEGQINDNHLIEKYNITRVQASTILKEYRQTYPDNLYYDQSANAYLIDDKFTAKNQFLNVTDYLHVITSTVKPTKSKLTLCAIEVEAPLRNINPQQVRPILKAIREQLAIDIGYISQCEKSALKKHAAYSTLSLIA